MFYRAPVFALSPVVLIVETPTLECPPPEVEYHTFTSVNFFIHFFFSLSNTAGEQELVLPINKQKSEALG